MAVKGHGTVRNGSGSAVEFRFGIQKVLDTISTTWVIDPLMGKTPPADWSYRQVDWAFERATARLRSSLFTMDRAGLHMHKCLTILTDPDYELRDGMCMSQVAVFMNAHQDVHLFADLVLHYAYDYANSLAVAMTRVLPDGDSRPAESSFFTHRRSIINGAGRDSPYRVIMSDHTKWFDKLAGTLEDPIPGRRTMIVHGHGKSPGPSDFRPEWGERRRDLIEIVGGLFEMLDQILPWLVTRLEPLAVKGSSLRSVVEQVPPFMTYQEPASEPTSFNHFLFPPMTEP